MNSFFVYSSPLKGGTKAYEIITLSECDRFQFLTNWPIFAKFSMNVMPLVEPLPRKF
jgi:hypothetical protein